MKSKKFTLATAAIGAAFLVWAISFVGVLLDPAAAGHVVTLATLIITLMGAVAGAGITGQSFIDWRHGSNINADYQNRREEKREYRREEIDIKVTETPSAEVARHFAQKYAGDPSYRPLQEEEA